MAGSLNDGKPSASLGQRGSHVKTGGKFEKPVDAVIKDSPWSRIQFDGQEFEQTFEATALVTAGPLANTYLGSVAWGWRSAPDGTSTLTPDPIALVEVGAPSDVFMAAAKKWNDAKLEDRSDPKKTFDTVDLPIAKSAGSMTDKEISDRIAALTKELAGATVTGKDQKQLEKHTLEMERDRRDAAKKKP